MTYLIQTSPPNLSRKFLEVSITQLPRHHSPVPSFQLYEEDAIIGHREFDLKLTQRVKMSMVGVPEMSFNFWAAYVLLQITYFSSPHN